MLSPWSPAGAGGTDGSSGPVDAPLVPYRDGRRPTGRARPAGRVGPSRKTDAGRPAQRHHGRDQGGRQPA